MKSLKRGDKKNGNKIYYLKLLILNGLPVPYGVIIEERDIKTLDTYKIARKIIKALKKEDIIILRTSSMYEDTEKESKAGIFKSVIVSNPNVQKIAKNLEDIIDHYKSIMGSIDGLNILAQKYIMATESGIYFSSFENHTLIAGIRGELGILTSGLEKGDEYWIKNGNITKKIIRPQYKVQRAGEVITRRYPYLSQKIPDKKIRKIIKVARKIENLLRMEIDMEFCFLGDRFYILQARPIVKNLTNRDIQVPFSDYEIVDIREYLNNREKYDKKEIVIYIPPEEEDIIPYLPKVLEDQNIIGIILDDYNPLSHISIRARELGKIILTTKDIKGDKLEKRKKISKIISCIDPLALEIVLKEGSTDIVFFYHPLSISDPLIVEIAKKLKEKTNSNIHIMVYLPGLSKKYGKEIYCKI